MSGGRWIAGSDGRVNWSRVTAAVGNVSWLAIVVVVLARMDPKADNAPEILWPVVVGTLAILGVNLGQYGINAWKDAKRENGEAVK